MLLFHWQQQHGGFQVFLKKLYLCFNFLLLLVLFSLLLPVAPALVVAIGALRVPHLAESLRERWLVKNVTHHFFLFILLSSYLLLDWVLD